MAVFCGDVFISKPRKFRLSFAVFQSSNLSFPYLTYPTIPCKIFTPAIKISRSAHHRCILVFVVFFLIFVYIKGYASSAVAHNCHHKRNNLTAKEITMSSRHCCGAP